MEYRIYDNEIKDKNLVQIKRYYKSGNERLEVLYENGQIVQVKESYDKQGSENYKRITSYKNGKKDGKEKTYQLYNICDHQECYKEVGSQAVAYTTGVPAMIGAMMIMTGKWNKPGVHNIEEFDPDPFMDALNTWGLPWIESHNPVLVD